MGFEKMVLSQVSDKFLRQATKGGSLVHAEKYSRASNSKVKAETHIPWAKCRPSQKVRGSLGCSGVSVYGLGNFIG